MLALQLFHQVHLLLLKLRLWLALHLFHLVDLPFSELRVKLLLLLTLMVQIRFLNQMPLQKVQIFLRTEVPFSQKSIQLFLRSL